MGNYEELWGIMGNDGVLWGNMRFYGELWGIVGNYGEVWGLMGDHEVLWGFMGMRVQQDIDCCILMSNLHTWQNNIILVKLSRNSR